MKRVSLPIDSLAFGGDGVGRAADGRVVFVPGTAPGDRVEARLVEEKKGFARARLERLVAPSPARVEPPCPIFRDEDCGGCQWQHVAAPAQRAAKEEIVRRALRHVCPDVRPIETPAPEYHWRRRARLRWRGRELGYLARRSRRLVDVPLCPQLEPLLEAALVAVREVVCAGAGAGEVHLLLGERGDVHVVVEGQGAAGLAGAAAALVGRAGIAGVVLRDGGERVLGTAEVDLGDEDAPFWAAADVFAQVSAPGNRVLRRLVLEAAGDLAGARVLELYAGSGNFTRDLAARAVTVAAVEEAPPAAALAARNLAARGLADRVAWRAEPVESALAAVGAADVVVVDPPRTGLAPGVPWRLAALGARRLVYVSCDPNTLARDLAALTGYSTVHATPVDLMPQTFHVEVVALAERP